MVHGGLITPCGGCTVILFLFSRRALTEKLHSRSISVSSYRCKKVCYLVFGDFQSSEHMHLVSTFEKKFDTQCLLVCELLDPFCFSE